MSFRNRRAQLPARRLADDTRPPAGPGQGQRGARRRRGPRGILPPCSSDARRRGHREEAGVQTVLRRRRAACRHRARCPLDQHLGRLCCRRLWPPCVRATRWGPRSGRRSCSPRQGTEGAPERFEMRGQRIDRLSAVFRLAQCLRVDAQLNDHRPTVEPCLVQCLQNVRRVGEGLVVDADPGEMSPGFRSEDAGEDHDAAAQLRRPWRCHWSNVPEGCSPEFRRCWRRPRTAGARSRGDRATLPPLRTTNGRCVRGRPPG